MDIKEIKIMVKEEYVSFETARLAKEKGFVPNVERHRRYKTSEYQIHKIY